MDKINRNIDRIGKLIYILLLITLPLSLLFALFCWTTGIISLFNDIESNNCLQYQNITVYKNGVNHITSFCIKYK